jgi:hypothetical protein
MKKSKTIKCYLCDGKKTIFFASLSIARQFTEPYLRPVILTVIGTIRIIVADQPVGFSRFNVDRRSIWTLHSFSSKVVQLC